MHRASGGGSRLRRLFNYRRSEASRHGSPPLGRDARPSLAARQPPPPRGRARPGARPAPHSHRSSVRGDGAGAPNSFVRPERSPGRAPPEGKGKGKGSPRPAARRGVPPLARAAPGSAALPVLRGRRARVARNGAAPDRPLRAERPAHLVVGGLPGGGVVVKEGGEERVFRQPAAGHPPGAPLAGRARSSRCTRTLAASCAVAAAGAGAGAAAAERASPWRRPGDACGREREAANAAGGAEGSAGRARVYVYECVCARGGVEAPSAASRVRARSAAAAAGRGLRYGRRHRAAQPRHPLRPPSAAAPAARGAGGTRGRSAAAEQRASGAAPPPRSAARPPAAARPPRPAPEKLGPRGPAHAPRCPGAPPRRAAPERGDGFWFFRPERRGVPRAAACVQPRLSERHGEPKPAAERSRRGSGTAGPPGSSSSRWGRRGPSPLRTHRAALRQPGRLPRCRCCCGKAGSCKGGGR